MNRLTSATIAARCNGKRDIIHYYIFGYRRAKKTRYGVFLCGCERDKTRELIKTHAFRGN